MIEKMLIVRDFNARLVMPGDYITWAWPAQHGLDNGSAYFASGRVVAVRDLDSTISLTVHILKDERPRPCRQDEEIVLTGRKSVPRFVKVLPPGDDYPHSLLGPPLPPKHPRSSPPPDASASKVEDPIICGTGLSDVESSGDAGVDRVEVAKVRTAVDKVRDDRYHMSLARRWFFSNIQALTSPEGKRIETNGDRSCLFACLSFGIQFRFERTAKDLVSLVQELGTDDNSFVVRLP